MRNVVEGVLIGLVLCGVVWAATAGWQLARAEGGMKMPAVQYVDEENRSRPVSGKDPLPTGPTTEWTVTAAGAGPQTATKPAASGQSHYVTGIDGTVAAAGFSWALKDGDTTILSGIGMRDASANGYVVREFARPVKISAGAAAALVITSEGAADTYANIAGYTR